MAANFCHFGAALSLGMQRLTTNETYKKMCFGVWANQS